MPQSGPDVHRHRGHRHRDHRRHRDAGHRSLYLQEMLQEIALQTFVARQSILANCKALLHYLL